LKPHFSSLKSIINGTELQTSVDYPISEIFIDSRNSIKHKSSLFFAISGPRNDGHNFIDSLYQSGVRNFVVEKDLNLSRIPEANVFKTDNCILALQAFAGKKRQSFKGKIIAITGSNGKTITKEWLGQLLEHFFLYTKAPEVIILR